MGKVFLAIVLLGYSGFAAFAGQALAACQKVGSHLLIRARSDVQVRPS